MSRAFDRRQVTSLLLGGAALAAGGCSTGSDPTLGATGSVTPSAAAGAGRGLAAATQSQVKVGLILPLSGSAQTAAIAKAMREAAELALFERKDAEIQLLVRDDKATDAGAKAAAEEAIKDGAELILGPLFSKSVAAVAPVARAAGVPVIGFSNDPTVAGKGVYLLSFSQSGEIARVVAHAAAAGKRRFAALIPDDADGRLIEPAFRTAVAAGGGAVAFVERYKIEESGVIDPARRFKDVLRENTAEGEPLDALFLPAGQDTLPQLAALIAQADLDATRVRLLGTSGWNYANVQRLSRLQGAWFAAPDPRGWTEFAERFGKAYKSMPPRLASLAHDGVVLAASLARAPKGQRFTDANLTRSSGFLGSDGTFRFRRDGMIDRDLVVLELQKPGPAIVDRPNAVVVGPQVDASPRGPRIN